MMFVTKLFTHRFIKDIGIIFLIASILYILIDQSKVNQKPKRVKGSWSIELMQHPLVFGLAGHNYLVLRDENNEIVKELHGLATDSATGGWKYVGNDKGDVLKVWEFDSSRYYIAQKNYPGVILKLGTRETNLMIWNKAEPCKEQINQKNIPYPPYGVNIKGDTENSNSVAYTLVKCMGLKAKHVGLLTPGWKKNLITGEVVK